MFNSSHIFPDAEIAEHEEICPERAMVERFELAEQTRQRTNIRAGDSGIICAASFRVDNDDDCWDDDVSNRNRNQKQF